MKKLCLSLDTDRDLPSKKYVNDWALNIPSTIHSFTTVIYKYVSCSRFAIPTTAKCDDQQNFTKTLFVPTFDGYPGLEGGGEWQEVGRTTNPSKRNTQEGPT